MIFNTTDEANAFFKNDRFAASNGMTVESVSEDTVLCGMTIRPDHLNANGTVMGGVYFTLADFAFAVSVNNIHTPSVTMDSNITYLTPAKGDRLTAECRVLRTGKTSTFCEVKVADGLGRLCAVFTATAVKL